MRPWLIRMLAALLLAACGQTPTPPEISTPAVRSDDLSAANAEAPQDFFPPAGCDGVSLESGPYDRVRTWTFYCDLRLGPGETLASTLQSRALAQGWRQCGGQLLYVKRDLVMRLQPVLERRPSALRPSRAIPPYRDETSFAVTQWARSGECA